MGTFRHKIEVGGPQGDRFEELDALVDTGATYTWIPQPVLEGLGHKPSLRRKLRLADGTPCEYFILQGTVIEREGVQAPVRIGEETLLTICLFGDEGSEPLLGAVTLEEFGLGVDPLNQQLVPIVSMLA